MARNTRSFTDIDLNFSPSSIFSVKNDGIGTLTCSTTSTTVTGTNTFFVDYEVEHRNIWISTTYIGKIKTINSNTSITLYNVAKATFTNQAYSLSNPADLIKRLDEQAIKASVRNLILTNNYERPFHPEIGSQVNSLLFELPSPMLKVVLERTIRNTIENFEPRVELISVNAATNIDNNRVNVSIIFTILNTRTVQAVNLSLERTR